MDKVYEPQKVEEEIYHFWEKGNYFSPKIDPQKKPFCLTLPPPNVTGGLHAGHAMFVIEDIMVRYWRMKQRPTLWLPGFDHASIAVEYLVTKQLKKEGKSKESVGREEFLKRATEFANDSRQYIRNQLKKLGFSLDWTREAYTMDETRSKAVKEAFDRLFKKGLIYKGERIVNWCPKCQTAISDLENDYQEEEGQLYYLKYGPIVVATTRPETIFADVAVAVNPKDKRYKKILNNKVPIPLTGRTIPIIADPAVDIKFGTGALKITPGHDVTDFEIGQRHNLETLTVIDLKGKLTDLAGKYAGMKVDEARKAVVFDLKEKGLLEKTENLKHSVGHCQRCGVTTEPLISQQWFVKTETMAKNAIEVVKSKQIKIVPKKFEKTYLHWLENIRDWCISRQLWWGHKIPLEGEKDILDTWFSSSLWPISVFGWPKNTKDFNYFYPTTVRETGYDILFFWVAREVMMCLAMTGKSPFETIYLHGLVRDEKGKKFSKTSGIGFDPLEIIEKYGADALRMALVFGTASGSDLSVGEEKIKSMRNFANKVWNASRFILNYLEKVDPKDLIKISSFEKNASNWILDELKKTTKTVSKQIENYYFGQAAETIYSFFWHQFCDKFIEEAKPKLFSKEDLEMKPDLVTLSILSFVLGECLKLLHPFMPFVTEEIWQKLPEKKKPLIISDWPK